MKSRPQRARTIEARAKRLPARINVGVEKDEETFSWVDYNIRPLDGPFGAFAIDEFGEKFSTECEWYILPGKSPEASTDHWQREYRLWGPNRVSSLRRAVENAGRIACAYGHKHLVDLPQMKERGRALNDAMSAIRVPLSSLLTNAAGDVDFKAFVGKRLPGDAEVAGLLLDQVRDAAATLEAAIGKLYDRFDIAFTSNSNTDPLPHEFIRQLVMVWRRFTGAVPANGRTSAFVAFVAAAWKDLGLEQGPDARSDDPEILAWFGELIVEKLPTLVSVGNLVENI